ncbi:MAG TPA: hypothetical protein VNR00_00085, partial [Opitutus sp.]|nr:hypothetical protein [Opitutus sp.]
MSGPASQENPPKAKRRRWPWLVVGFLGGSGVVAGLLFAPPVQGWLLRRMIATQPGWRVNFETFGIAPTGVQARGLEFAMPGLQAQAEPLAVRIAPGRLLTKRELQIERVEAQKVRVTITPAQLASGDSAEPFTGLLTLLQSPLPWLLDEARIDGEIAVRDGDTAVVVGSFKLEGGQLSATTPGEFTYELTVNSALLPLGPDNKVRSRGTIRLTQNRRYGVAKIEIAGDLTL